MNCRVLIACLAVFGCLLYGSEGIRQALISEFPQLPEGVRKDLRVRGCTVPQPPNTKKLRNVIRGRFRVPQEMDWAVLCDMQAKGTSLLLVYWGGRASAPAIVFKSRMNDQCWSDINPVGGAFIMEHYRAYGGPVPPPIDHEGIDVGICEKASTVSYFYRNRWLTLTGSD